MIKFEMLRGIIAMAVVAGLFGYFIVDSIVQFIRRDKSTLKDHFDKCFKRSLDDDINEEIISIIETGFTIRSTKYSVVDIVRPRDLFQVVIKVDAYDYGIKKRVTGYFMLEYLYVPEIKEFIISSRCSRSMPIETKRAAKIPYGGWFKDCRQAADEEKAYMAVLGN